MNIKAIDVFCGIGGLTKGIENVGINVVAGIDSDQTCQYAYEKNTNSIFLNKPIEDIDIDEIKHYYYGADITILMGCAPCQPFSNYSLRYNKFGMKDEKWKLLNYFLKIVKEIKPKIVSMENVPQLVNKQIFKDFVSGLKEQGYYVSYRIVNCVDFGVPQKRNRLVLLASQYGSIDLIPMTHKEPITVRDAIGHLEAISNGEQSDVDPLHRASKLSKVNEQRIKQSIQGGTWDDWDKKLILSCHKKKTGKSYKSVYGRMKWDEPSPTITTQFFGYGNGRFGHPEQHRALSLREGAILQSFPEDYDLGLGDGVYNMKKIGTHIGNAVPVKLAEAIGISILNHLCGRSN